MCHDVSVWIPQNGRLLFGFAFTDQQRFLSKRDTISGVTGFYMNGSEQQCWFAWERRMWFGVGQKPPPMSKPLLKLIWGQDYKPSTLCRNFQVHSTTFPTNKSHQLLSLLMCTTSHSLGSLKRYQTKRTILVFFGGVGRGFPTKHVNFETRNPCKL